MEHEILLIFIFMNLIFFTQDLGLSRCQVVILVSSVSILSVDVARD